MDSSSTLNRTVVPFILLPVDLREFVKNDLDIDSNKTNIDHLYFDPDVNTTGRRIKGTTVLFKVDEESISKYNLRDLIILGTSGGGIGGDIEKILGDEGYPCSDNSDFK